MPDTQLYTQEAAARKVVLIIASIALSKLRLFKEGLSVTQFTTKALLVAAECDFSGYTAGGYTLTAWTGPITASGGGAIETSPMTNVAFVDPDPDPVVGNAVGGWWVEDATGNVRVVGTYSPVRLIQGPGDGFSVVVQILEAKNPVSVFTE